MMPDSWQLRHFQTPFPNFCNLLEESFRQPASRPLPIFENHQNASNPQFKFCFFVFFEIESCDKQRRHKCNNGASSGLPPKRAAVLEAPDQLHYPGYGCSAAQLQPTDDNLNLHMPRASFPDFVSPALWSSQPGCKDTFVAETVRNLWLVSQHHQKRVANARILHWPSAAPAYAARQNTGGRGQEGGQRRRQKSRRRNEPMAGIKARRKRDCRTTIEDTSSNEHALLRPNLRSKRVSRSVARRCKKARRAMNEQGRSLWRQ